MGRVNIKIGPLIFDHADHDAENDLLYLHLGKPQVGEGEETPDTSLAMSSTPMRL